MIWLKPVLGFMLLAAAAAEDDCNSHGSAADKQQYLQQQKMQQESNAQVGMPGITNFTEKRLMRQLYELRDKSITTFTYVPDMNGRLFHLCDSVGYGLPYGAQFSNPQYIAYTGSGCTTLPQPEPNGLYMPPAAEGTWIACASTSGKLDPVYVEPRVIVSPFKLRAAGEYADK